MGLKTINYDKNVYGWGSYDFDLNRYLHALYLPGDFISNLIGMS